MDPLQELAREIDCFGLLGTIGVTVTGILLVIFATLHFLQVGNGNPYFGVVVRLLYRIIGHPYNATASVTTRAMYSTQ